jgi:trehalose 6-phosphate synthase
MARRHRLVIVANRLPVRRALKQGRREWARSPGGLVSALAPVVEKTDAAWVGWAGVGAAAEALKPFRDGSIELYPVRLSKAELDDYYYGFSNRTLWPLYHDAVRWPEYSRAFWDAYVAVNRRYAEAAARVAARGAMVWVQDYHLQLVPRMVRSLRPDLRVGFFLHVPFPPPELFAQLPWRREILQGLLAADVVGFQTPANARNFAWLAKRYAGAKGSRRALAHEGRRLRVDAFPVSIDVARFETLAKSRRVRERAEKLRAKIGPYRKVILGVDRLDYTKGIDLRLRAFQELLSRREVSIEDCVFVQTAVPSRERVATYTGLKERVEMLVGQINGEFADVGRVAVHYLHRSLPVDELVALYVVADVMLVTPFRDGMNLIAKEYVATRLDDTGVLVLSEFTGAALELRQALLVNPHDIDGLAAALNQALRMPRGDIRRRMRTLRAVVRAHDVQAWGRQFLEALGHGMAPPAEGATADAGAEDPEPLGAAKADAA